MDGTNGRGLSAVVNRPEKAAVRRAKAVSQVVESLAEFSRPELSAIIQAAKLCLDDPEKPESVQEEIDALHAKNMERFREEIREKEAPEKRGWWR